MNAFSPIHSYVIGTASIGLGLHALFWPRREYGRLGLPLEPSRHPSSANTSPPRTKEEPEPTGGLDSTSPLVYLKGIRDISYGLALIALQYQDSVVGVTTIAGVLSLVAFGDGFVVWYHGGDSEEWGLPDAGKKARGYWGAAVGLGCWAAWRVFVAYGEWAAFHALN